LCTRNVPEYATTTPEEKAYIVSQYDAGKTAKGGARDVRV